MATKQANPVGMVRDSYGIDQMVEIRKGRDGRWTFYAPGWRVLKFVDPEIATLKMEQHPAFVGWAM